MTILSALRERLSGPDASAESRSVGDAQRDPVEEARLPFAGYDRLDERQVVHGLSDHSQIELEAIESYERSHESRQPVLDKLRWMRGREPLPGYDARGVEEIVAALEDTDLDTLWKVRAYERKFANRPAVLEAVVRVHHRRVAVRPPSAAPAYQSASATSASRAPVDRPEVNHGEERAAMTDFPTLSAEVTRSLTSLWTRYAGKAPTSGHTEIRGNVVTCALAGAVGPFNRSMSAPQTGDTVRGVGKLTPAAYKREAVAAVGWVTRQRVASFVSSHDRDTDVATEVFTLEPSLGRGAPALGERRFGQASPLPPPRPPRALAEI